VDYGDRGDSKMIELSRFKEVDDITMKLCVDILNNGTDIEVSSLIHRFVNHAATILTLKSKYNEKTYEEFKKEVERLKNHLDSILWSKWMSDKGVVFSSSIEGAIKQSIIENEKKT